MIEERTKLQSETQQLKIELDSQKKLRKSLEQENATLMDRVSGFESQQVKSKNYNSKCIEKEVKHDRNSSVYHAQGRYYCYM